MIRKLATVLSLGIALLLSSCIQFEQIVTVNPDGSGKVTTNAMVDFSVAGALLQQTLGGKEGAVKPMDGEARKMLLQILAQTEGIDVWSEAKSSTEADGKFKVSATGYFKDVTKLKLANSLGGAGDNSGIKLPGGGLPAIGQIKSSKDGEGNWVLGVPLLDGLGGKEPQPPAREEPAPEKKESKPPANPAVEQTIAKFKEQRLQFMMVKVLLSQFLGSMKMSQTLIVGGSIKDSGCFTKMSDNTAKMELSAMKAMDGLEAVFNDEALIRMIAEAGGTNPLEAVQGLAPEAKAALDKVKEAILGAKGEPRLVIKPGEPVFDYNAETTKAKAGLTPELQALLKDAEKAGKVENEQKKEEEKDPPK